MTSDMIFCIGLAVTAVSVIWLIAGLTVLRFRALSLKTVLDEEYGKETGALKGAEADER